MTAHPRQHLPAADHRGLRPGRGRADRCATCTSSASTGSTCRRCWRRRPGSEHGYDVVDHRAIDPARGRASGPGRAGDARRGGSAWACWSTSCPTTSGVARPWENEWWWHVLTHGQESPYARAFDIDWAAGGGKLRIPVVGDDDLLPRTGAIDNLHGARRRAALPRPALPARAGHRPRRRRGSQRRPRPAALRAGQLARGRPQPELPAVLRREHPGRGPGRGPGVVRRKSHAEIRRWFDEGLVDGLRVDHPDGLRDPGKYLDDLAAPHRRRLRAGREDPRDRDAATRRACGWRSCRRPGRPPAPPATTRWR